MSSPADFSVVDEYDDSEEFDLLACLSDLCSPREFQRLPRQIRSQFRCLSSREYLYVKGAEVVAENFHQYVGDLGGRRYRSSGHSYLHHFSHYEGKVPAVLSITEARREAKIASHLQESHLKITGEWLPIPRPLWVLTACPQRVASVKQTILALVEQSVRSRCSQILDDDGVGIYFYLQRSRPHRLDDFLDKRSWYYLRDSFGMEPVLDESFASWVYVFLFMLSQNVLALHEDCIGLGSPIDKGNLCLDGGLADMGTCHLVSPSTGEGFVRRSFGMSRESLVSLASDVFSVERMKGEEILRHAVGAAVDRSPHLLAGLTRSWVNYSDF